MRRIGLAMFGFLIAHESFAFEVGGYRSGMSFAEAQIEAAQQGLGIFPMSMDNYRVGTSDSSDARYVLFFCNDSLKFISYNIAGGFHAFASELKRSAQVYGTPTLTASSDYGPNGLVSTIRGTFYTASDETVSVSATLIDDYSAPSVSVSMDALPGQPCQT